MAPSQIARETSNLSKGGDLLISWKDGTSDWIKLKDMKDSYPVKVTQYAGANKISLEPAFAYMVDSTYN